MALIETRRGTTRRVFLIGRYAVKVPNWGEYRLFLNGLLGNMQETQFWRGLQGRKAQRMMCPVLLSVPGGWLVIMPRCEPISRQSFGQMKTYEVQQYTNGHLPLSRWNGQGIPVEHKLDSYGRLDGRIVAVDYGS